MNTFDVAVIGAGAAGLSAALVLLRARRSVVVIDAGSPRNAPAAHMHGFLSRDGMPPTDLLRIGRSEITGYGGSIIHAAVTRIDPGFALLLSTGDMVRARRILASTGLSDEIPDVPGVRERWGRDVLHCPYCHGYEVRDQPLGILGGATEEVAHALLIRQWSADVTLFPHADALSAEQEETLTARGVRIVKGEVRRMVVEDDRLVGVQLVDGRMIPRTAVFVRPRFRPNTALLTDLGCRVDERGWTEHDGAGRTSVPGVFVAGNAADPRAQVITAAGQGSAAAIAINADLVDDETAAAVLALRAQDTSANRTAEPSSKGHRA